MASLEALLAGRNLSRLVEGIKSGLPLRVPEEFLRVTDSFSGHTAEWIEVDGNRDLATVVSQTSPAKAVGQQNTKSKSVNMLRAFEMQTHMANNLRNLVDPTASEGTRDDKGRKFVTRQAEWFKKRQDNLIQTAVQSMLFRFALYFNGQGELLPSSSGATVSVDPAIPAGQTGQLDILGGGAIISTTWATDSVDIIGDLYDIRDQMRQLGGWEMRHAFYGRNIPQYIASNDEAKVYIQQNPALSAQKYAGGNMVPDGFCEYMWHNAADAFYLNASGTVVKLLGDDEIMFCPDPSEDWWGLFNGSEMVPNGTLETGQTVEAALGGLTEVEGSFMYSRLAYNPVAIELFGGVNFLPVIKATKAVCKADVVP